MAVDDTPAVLRTIQKVGAGGRDVVEDRVVAEAPLEIRLGGVALAVLMRTPGDDRELVTGFALTEGMVLSPAEIRDVQRLGAGDDARWELVPARGVDIDPERFRRNLYATSSCGVCGKASIDAVRVAAAPAAPGPVVPPARLQAMVQTMTSAQAGFAETGGLHAAALFAPDGELIDVREDVGRHNAVDKVIGATAADRWPLAGLVLVVSGRVSFEIIQKAAVAGLTFVAGVSAASSLAIDLAAELGLTVAGFVRPEGLNCYTGCERFDAADGGRE